MKIFKKPVYIGLGLFVSGILVSGIVTNTVVKNLNVGEQVKPTDTKVLYEEKEEQIKAPAEKEQTESIVNEEIKEEEFKWSLPVEGEIIVKHSGNELIYSKTLGDFRKHSGVDIRADMLSKVYSAERGIVKEKKNDAMMGITIVIDHQNGFCSVYSNLSTAEMVEVGQKVEKGTVISGIGDTALSETGEEAHLHFELLKDGAPVNPEDYLPF